ncbi:SubName: Full=Uncharacterized protein {ECO:0000313/EMBL:CCA71900.1} [Serendipita indica DSM 11827]|nr:SubName: Full=Uncharacterized protein {ECO:0000313/EMBL:CCA71900.1} [Serendipita indica DSM 11827]
MSSPTTTRARPRRASRAAVATSIDENGPSSDAVMTDEDAPAALKPAAKSQVKRRGRKSQKVIESDEEEDEDGYERGKSSTMAYAATPEQSQGEGTLPAQEMDNGDISLGLFEDDAMGSTTPQVPPGVSPLKKNGAMMRRTKKKAASATPSRGEDGKMTDSNTMDVTESQASTNAVGESQAVIGQANVSTPNPTSKASISTPGTLSSQPEGTTKRKEMEGGSSAPERPAKRAKLPPIKKHAVTPGSGTPSGSTVDKLAGKIGRERQIVDGPVTNDIDLRNEDAFAQLFKKSGTGKSEARYDLTTSEKMEQKKAELSRLREEYVTKKNKAKASCPIRDLQ